MAATAAGAADLSGTWVLNIQKSKWGKHPKPATGTIMNREIHAKGRAAVSL